MNPPEMRPWNLALRLGLEIGALTGLGLAARTQTEGAARPVAVVATPAAAAALWGTFNVPDDPSRSGELIARNRSDGGLVALRRRSAELHGCSSPQAVDGIGDSYISVIQPAA